MNSLRSVRSFSWFGLSLLALAAVPVRAEMKPFDLNLDRVSVSEAKGLAAGTYFVPGVNLEVSCEGDFTSQNKGGGANAVARGRYYVQGLDKAFVQDLARKIQDDLVAKLRATGATVLTYADLKDHPVVSGQGRKAPDEKWGLPTAKGFGAITFLTAAPTDSQAYEHGMSASAAWWMRTLAKEKDLVGILPTYTFRVPQMWGEKESSYSSASASISVNPVMIFQGGQINAINGKGGAPTILIQEHGGRHAAEVTGKIRKLSEDTTNFSKSWGRTKADYLFTLDQEAFSDGVLRVAYAVNTMIADQVKKVRK